MAAKRKPPVAIKASESVVSRMLAGLTGAPAFEQLSDVWGAIAESQPTIASLAIGKHVAMFPWTADVPAQVMSDRLGPLVEHVVSYPDEVFVVKDSVRSGPGGLWLVTAAPFASEIMGGALPWRGLFNHFFVDGEQVCVRAIQIESCLRKP